MLHTLLHSPAHCDLESLLLMAGAGDDLLLLQDGVTFMSGEEDVTAGCDVSQKYLRRVSPCSTKPAKDVEFLVNPLSKDGPVLLFNLGLIASGTAMDSNGNAADWTVPIVIDPKIRNMS